MSKRLLSDASFWFDLKMGPKAINGTLNLYYLFWWGVTPDRTFVKAHFIILLMLHRQISMIRGEQNDSVFWNNSKKFSEHVVNLRQHREIISSNFAYFILRPISRAILRYNSVLIDWSKNFTSQSNSKSVPGWRSSKFFHFGRVIFDLSTFFK